MAIEGSGPRPTPAALQAWQRDIYTELGRVTAKLEDLGDRVTEIREDQREFRKEVRERFAELPAAPQRSPSSENNPAIRKRDLDDTAKLILAETERTFEQRLHALEKEREEASRRAWDWRVGLVGKLVPILLALIAGSGLTWAARCNPAPGAQHQTQQHKAPATMPARR